VQRGRSQIATETLVQKRCEKSNLPLGRLEQITIFVETTMAIVTCLDNQPTAKIFEASRVTTRKCGVLNMFTLDLATVEPIFYFLILTPLMALHFLRRLPVE
jgi:hypothetical protein